MLQSACWPNDRIFESKSQRKLLGPDRLKHPKVSKEQWELLHSQKKGGAGLTPALLEEDSDDSGSDEDDETKVSRQKKELELLIGDQICSAIKLFKLHGSLTQADRSDWDMILVDIGTIVINTSFDFYRSTSIIKMSKL